jgi:hypothetical protein
MTAKEMRNNKLPKNSKWRHEPESFFPASHLARNEHKKATKVKLTITVHGHC